MPDLQAAGTSRLPWHALFIFAQRAQELPGTALSVAVHGKSAQWSVTEQFLSGLTNMVEWLIWSKSKDASKPGAKPPKPHYLPGLEPVDKDAKHRGTATPIADVLKMLGPQAQEMYRNV